MHVQASLGTLRNPKNVAAKPTARNRIKKLGEGAEAAFEGVRKRQNERSECRRVGGDRGHRGRTTTGEGTRKRTVFGPSPTPRKKESKKVPSRRLCLARKGREVRQEMHCKGVRGFWGPVACRRVVGAVVVGPESSVQFLREEKETDVTSEDDGFEGVAGRQQRHGWGVGGDMGNTCMQ